MTKFSLKIICPDYLVYDGTATFFKVRTFAGDIGIAGKHSNYFTMIDAAECEIKIDDNVHYAACADGFVSILDEKVKVVVTTFEWSEQLDPKRAEKAYEKSKHTLSAFSKDDEGYALMYAKFKRAENRLHVLERQGQ